MLAFELMQFVGDDGVIYFDLAGNRKEERNIKPFFGKWKNFTNKKIFTEDKDNIGYTVKYKGFKRLLVNFIAAATLAKYDWHVSSGN